MIRSSSNLLNFNNNNGGNNGKNGNNCLHLVNNFWGVARIHGKALRKLLYGHFPGVG